MNYIIALCVVVLTFVLNLCIMVIDTCKRIIITMPTPPINPNYVTGTYPTYTDDMFIGLVCIMPMHSYWQALRAQVRTYVSTAMQMRAERTPMFTHYMSTPMHTHTVPTTTHSMNNVVPEVVECMPDVGEQVQAISGHASFGDAIAEYVPWSVIDMQGDAPMPTYTPVPTVPIYHTEMDEYDMPMLEDGKWSEPGPGGRMGHKGYTHKGYRRLVDMTVKPTPHTTTTMAQAILKGEQEEAMWADRTDAITVDELWYSSYYSPSPIEFLCECGSNACSCSEDRAINEQAEYDEANGLCLNCHQSPCCFDCCYDETEEDLNGFPSWWVIKAYGTDCARCDQHVGYCDCEGGPYPPSCGPSSFED